MATVQKVKSPDVLIVDMEHMCYRAFFVYTDLHTKIGIPSGVFYGVLSMIKKQVNKFTPGKVILVWGGVGSNSFRKTIFPGYKSNRKHGADFGNQLHDLKRFFSSLNWEQCFNSNGYEADDVIATIAHEYDKQGNVVYIISGDHDFHQLVNANITCVVPGTSQRPDKIFTPDTVLSTYGIPADLLADYYAMRGDTADAIPGVPGIGEVTAAKLLIQNGAIKMWFNSIESMVASVKQKAVLSQYKHVMVLNKKLMSLKNTNINVEYLPKSESISVANEILSSYEIVKFTYTDFYNG